MDLCRLAQPRNLPDVGKNEPESLVDLRPPVIREPVAWVLRIAISVGAAFVHPVADYIAFWKLKDALNVIPARIALLGARAAAHCSWSSSTTRAGVPYPERKSVSGVREST